MPLSCTYGAIKETLESASLGLRGKVRTRCVNLEISSMGNLHFLFNIYLFVFGCSGSSLPGIGFSSRR